MTDNEERFPCAVCGMRVLAVQPHPLECCLAYAAGVAEGKAEAVANLGHGQEENHE